MFKAYSILTSDIYMHPLNYHHNQYTKSLYQPPKFLMLPCNLSIMPHLPHPSNSIPRHPLMCFLIMQFALSRLLDAIIFFFWLLQLSVIFCEFFVKIHPSGYTHISVVLFCFLLFSEQYSIIWIYCNLPFLHSHIEEHLCCFQY